MESGIFAKIHVAEIKRVISFRGGLGEKTRGEIMKVSLAMLLKTHGEKMPDNRSLAMLMKRKEIEIMNYEL